MAMEPSLPAAIGRRVASLRDRNGVSQADLARSADVSNPYLSQIESGQRTPSVETLLRLADALGCQPCELLKDEVGV